MEGFRLTPRSTGALAGAAQQQGPCSSCSAWHASTALLRRAADGGPEGRLGRHPSGAHSGSTRHRCRGAGGPGAKVLGGRGQGRGGQGGRGTGARRQGGRARAACRAAQAKGGQASSSPIPGGVLGFKVFRVLGFLVFFQQQKPKVPTKPTSSAAACARCVAAGKTRTILNLLSVIMHAAQKDALQALKVRGVRLLRLLRCASLAQVMGPQQLEGPLGCMCSGEARAWGRNWQHANPACTPRSDIP